MHICIYLYICLYIYIILPAPAAALPNLQVSLPTELKKLFNSSFLGKLYFLGIPSIKPLTPPKPAANKYINEFFHI